MIVYKTINLINNKFYIGQDSKNNPNYLGSGLLLKKAINKYGKENFRKEILEYCQSKQELNEAEVWWIDYLKAKELGYNIRNGGQRKYLKGRKRNKFSQKWLENMSKSQGGRLFKVYKKDTCEFLKEYLIQAQCARDLNVSHSDIIMCLKNKIKYSGNYIFKYSDESPPKLEEVNNFEKIRGINISKGKNVQAFLVYKLKDIRRKPKNYNDKYFIGRWEIQTRCAKELNLRITDINNCLKGKQKSCKGYVFIYERGTKCHL